MKSLPSMFQKAVWLWTATRISRMSSSQLRGMESREGIAYLLASCGFKVKLEEINLRAGNALERSKRPLAACA